MNPTIDDLCRRSAELCQKLAPAELAGVPFYVVSQAALSSDLGRESVCHAYTTPCLDLYLRDVIGRDWRGRGACVVVNDVALQREFADTFELKFLGTVVHELAHVLERPSPYRPRQDADEHALHSEARQVSVAVSDPAPAAETAKPWLGHEARFLRVAMHLWHRAKAQHVYLKPSQIVVGEYYALSPANWYAIATESEAKDMASATFREICAQKLPVAFRRLWASDITNWLLRKELS